MHINQGSVLDEDDLDRKYWPTSQYSSSIVVNFLKLTCMHRYGWNIPSRLICGDDCWIGIWNIYRRIHIINHSFVSILQSKSLFSLNKQVEYLLRFSITD